jgi:4-hydroxy-tetrahydrodipicolinate reductase
MEEWRERAATGRFGHVGMPESVALVGHALGFELDDIACTLEPVVSDRKIQTEFLEVKADAPAGIRNIGVGKSRGVERVRLDLAMYVGAREPRDTISLQGDPSLELVIPGGTPGDPATAAILLNTLPRVVQAQPGLLTVLDIPPARCGW